MLNEEKLFFGIDLSLTGTGIICLNDNCDIIIKKILSTKNDKSIEKRHIYIKNEIISIINSNFPCIIFCEGLSYNSKNKSSNYAELAGLHYIIRAEFDEMNIKYKIVPPTVLKKFITGKGNVKKNLMLLQIYKKFNIEFDNDNLADAFGLAKMAYEENK